MNETDFFSSSLKIILFSDSIFMPNMFDLYILSKNKEKKIVVNINMNSKIKFLADECIQSLKFLADEVDGAVVGLAPLLSGCSLLCLGLLSS